MLTVPRKDRGGKQTEKYFEAILSKPYPNSFLNAQENTKSAITW